MDMSMNSEGPYKTLSGDRGSQGQEAMQTKSHAGVWEAVVRGAMDGSRGRN